MKVLEPETGNPCTSHHLSSPVIRREDERLLERVLERARRSKGFLSRWSVARDAYLDQIRLAHEHADQLRQSGMIRFEWMHRPNVHALALIFKRVALPDFTAINVARKLMPLLIEWDVRQGPCHAGQ